MKKLCFKYSAMNAGKSMHLIMTYNNYKELGYKPIAVLPNGSKTKCIHSRTGAFIKAVSMSKLVDILYTEHFDCILIDEAQFLSKEEIEWLSNVTIWHEIPVTCYGLRNNCLGELFEGASYLLALADEIEELSTLCFCGNEAKMNLRLVDGKVDKSRQIIKLKEEGEVSYISVCRECFYKYFNSNENLQYLVDKFDNARIRS